VLRGPQVYEPAVYLEGEGLAPWWILVQMFVRNVRTVLSMYAAVEVVNDNNKRTFLVNEQKTLQINIALNEPYGTKLCGSNAV